MSGIATQEAHATAMYTDLVVGDLVAVTKSSYGIKGKLGQVIAFTTGLKVVVRFIDEVRVIHTGALALAEEAHG